MSDFSIKSIKNQTTSDGTLKADASISATFVKRTINNTLKTNQITSTDFQTLSSNIEGGKEKLIEILRTLNTREDFSILRNNLGKLNIHIPSDEVIELSKSMMDDASSSEVLGVVNDLLKDVEIHQVVDDLVAHVSNEKPYQRTPKDIDANLHEHFNGVLSPEQFVSIMFKNIVNLDIQLNPIDLQQIKDIHGDNISSQIEAKKFISCFEYLKANIAPDSNAGKILLVVPTPSSYQQKFDAVCSVLSTKSNSLTLVTMPFDETYALKSSLFFKSDIFENNMDDFVVETVNQLSAEGIKYAEVQGSFQNDETYHKVDLLCQQKGIQIFFMDSQQLKYPSSEKEINENVTLVCDKLDPRRRIIGVDFLGAEADISTNKLAPVFLSEMIKGVSAKAQLLKEQSHLAPDKKLVVRIHIGEGYSEKTPNLMDKSEKELARKNIDKVIETIKKIPFDDRKNVLMRIGHATHATPKHLFELKELGVVVEANLSSNKSTGAISKRKDYPLAEHLLFSGLMGMPSSIVLGIDGGGVMNSTMGNENIQAKQILDTFSLGKTQFCVRNFSAWFKTTMNELDLLTDKGKQKISSLEQQKIGSLDKDVPAETIVNFDSDSIKIDSIKNLLKGNTLTEVQRKTLNFLMDSEVPKMEVSLPASLCEKYLSPLGLNDDKTTKVKPESFLSEKGLSKLALCQYEFDLSNNSMMKNNGKYLSPSGLNRIMIAQRKGERSVVLDRRDFVIGVDDKVLAKLPAPKERIFHFDIHDFNDNGKSMFSMDYLVSQNEVYKKRYSFL